jgi:hypothetical protein
LVQFSFTVFDSQECHSRGTLDEVNDIGHAISGNRKGVKSQLRYFLAARQTRVLAKERSRIGPLNKRGPCLFMLKLLTRCSSATGSKLRISCHAEWQQGQVR